MIAEGSFRDPAGFVFLRDNVLYRQVNQSYQSAYDRLMSSGLYEDLVGQGLLIGHEEADRSLGLGEQAYKVLRPTRVPFISYPYEWCFSQLKDAAGVTLRVQQTAMRHGMTLKDASAYNVQILGGKPVFIDTLSFEEYREGRPWAGYGQFCRHFLAPLALMAKVDVRLGQLSRVHFDGVPLDLATGLLPWSSRLSLGLGLHIHGHAASVQKHGGDGMKATAPQISRRGIEGLVDNLLGTVNRLDWQLRKSEWSDYYEGNNNYSDAELNLKGNVLAELLEGISTTMVWDLGANTGRFSRLAVAGGGNVISWDIDPACVEANYRQVKAIGERNVLPLLLDLTNPSPALGWAHAERSSLRERGPAEVVMALGLVHHLAIGNNVPLAAVARFLAQLGKWLIIEFVPKDDSQVKKLLATREDIFPDYSREGFERAFGAVFQIERRAEVGNMGRTLYRMKGRGVVG